jgi:hypothetical protein
MRLNVPDEKFIVTRQESEDGKTSIHIGNIDTGPVCELLLFPGQHVEVTRNQFAHLHIPGFGAEVLPAAPQQVAAITAVVWDGSDESSDALLAMGADFSVQESLPPYLTLRTPTGKLGARVGDTITRAADGSFAVLKAA